MIFVQQSACRLLRALFEITLRKGWSSLAIRILTVCKMTERRMWTSQSPLRQFGTIPDIIIKKLERSSDIPWNAYFDLKPQDLGEIVKIPKMGKTLYKYIHMFPKVEVSANFLPLSRSTIKVELTILADFQLEVGLESSFLFWIIIEDADGETILHYECFTLNRRNIKTDHLFTFPISIQFPIPPQYFVKIVSDRWLHSDFVLPVSFRNLILPTKFAPCTELLDLQPLPVESIKMKFNSDLLFPGIHIFNPIQTQTVPSILDHDENILICSPIGTGKTNLAILAILKQISSTPHMKCVYVTHEVSYIYIY